MKKRMIGIKIDDDSNLPERLRIVSAFMRLEYQELLEKWIWNEEQEYMLDKPSNFIVDMERGANLPKPEDLPDEPVKPEDLPDEPVKPEDLPDEPVKPEDLPDEPVKPELKPFEQKILKLSEQGYSIREIAAKLEAGGVLTAKGMCSWNAGTVHKILTRLKS